MGRCEKERTDFKQKVDHRFYLPNSDIAAQSFFFAHGHASTTWPSQLARLCPLSSLITQNNDLRSSWSIVRSLRALLSHTLKVAQAHRNLVLQPLWLPQSRPSLR